MLGGVASCVLGPRLVYLQQQRITKGLTRVSSNAWVTDEVETYHQRWTQSRIMAPGCSRGSKSLGYRPSQTADAHWLQGMSAVVIQKGWDSLANSFSIV